MSRALIVHRASPGLSVQDLGRPGTLAQGLSRGGAADRLALAEGAALLGQPEGSAALEMAGFGGTFEAAGPLRIALTGAPMPASLGGARLAWNASHLVPDGAQLSIGGAEAGTYGYLHVGGGLDTPEILGARSMHLASGLGGQVQNGARLPVGHDPAPADIGQHLQPEPRLAGGTVRVVASLQTDLFGPDAVARFQATRFVRDARGSRMGVRLLGEGAGFHAASGLSVISEIVVPGDIQITGDGTPFVLLAECQPTGGYPRIASVLPCDLPRVAQAPPGAVLRFRFVSLAEAVAAERRAHRHRAGLARARRPLLRRPHDMGDLLSHQLVGGVTAGDDLERGES